MSNYFNINVLFQVRIGISKDKHNKTGRHKSKKKINADVILHNIRLYDTLLFNLLLKVQKKIFSMLL